MRKLKREMARFYSLDLRLQVYETMPQATFAAVTLLALHLISESTGAAIYTGALALVFICARVVSADEKRWSRWTKLFRRGGTP